MPQIFGAVPLRLIRRCKFQRGAFPADPTRRLCGQSDAANLRRGALAVDPTLQILMRRTCGQSSPRISDVAHLRSICRREFLTRRTCDRSDAANLRRDTDWPAEIRAGTRVFPLAVPVARIQRSGCPIRRAGRSGSRLSILQREGCRCFCAPGRWRARTWLRSS